MEKVCYWENDIAFSETCVFRIYFSCFRNSIFEEPSLFSEFAYGKRLPCAIRYSIVTYSSLKGIFAISFQADFMGLRFQTAEPSNQEFSSHIAWRGRRFLLATWNYNEREFCKGYCFNIAKDSYLWLTAPKKN
jgi:hypothetical protein